MKFLSKIGIFLCLILIFGLGYLGEIDAKTPRALIFNQSGILVGTYEVEKRGDNDYDFKFVPTRDEYEFNKLEIYGLDDRSLNQTIIDISQGFTHETITFERGSMFYDPKGRNTFEIKSPSHLTSFLHKTKFRSAHIQSLSGIQPIEYLTTCKDWSERTWSCVNNNWTKTDIYFDYNETTNTYNYTVYNFSSFQGELDFYTGLEDADSNLCNGGSNFTGGICQGGNYIRGNQEGIVWRDNYAAEAVDNIWTKVFTRYSHSSNDPQNAKVSLRSYVYFNSSNFSLTGRYPILGLIPPSGLFYSVELGIKPNGKGYCYYDPFNYTYRAIHINDTPKTLELNKWHYFEIYGDDSTGTAISNISCAINGHVFARLENASSFNDLRPFRHFVLGQPKGFEIGNLTWYFDEVRSTSNFPIGGFPNITGVGQLYDTVNSTVTQTISINGSDLDVAFKVSEMNSSWLTLNQDLNFDGVPDHRYEGIRVSNQTYVFNISPDDYDDLPNINYTVYLNDSRGQEALNVIGSFNVVTVRDSYWLLAVLISFAGVLIFLGFMYKEDAFGLGFFYLGLMLVYALIALNLLVYGVNPLNTNVSNILGIGTIVGYWLMIPFYVIAFVKLILIGVKNLRNPS